MYEMDFVGLVFVVIGLHAHQKHDHTLSALRLKIRDLSIFISQVYEEVRDTLPLSCAG